MGSIFSPPKPPAAPDPAKTIEAQKEVNQVAQFTPTGNLTYGSYDPKTGEFTAKATDALQVTESPFQEATRLGGEQLTSNLLSQLLANPQALSEARTASQIESGLMPLSTDFSSDIQRLEDATYEQTASRLRPEFEKQRSQLEQRLADQGLPIGSDAYNEEINRLEQNQNDQLQNLALQSVQAGRSEQDRLARLGATLRGQQFNEQTSLTTLENQARAGRFGEIGSVLGFASPFTQYNTPQIDVAGIINQGYQNQLNAFNNRQAGNLFSPQNLGLLAQAGATAYASDIRIKENIEEKGTRNGFKWYEFNYKWSPQRFGGVMAQDVEKIKPEAVIEENGYKLVNYDMLGLKMEIL